MDEIILLHAIKETGEKYGTHAPIGYLKGSKAKKMDEIPKGPTYNISTLKDESLDHWQNIHKNLRDKKLIQGQTIGYYTIYILTQKGHDLIKENPILPIISSLMESRKNAIIQNVQHEDNRGKIWTPEEDQILKEEVSQKMTIQEISKNHKRSCKGIFARIVQKIGNENYDEFMDKIMIKIANDYINALHPSGSINALHSDQTEDFIIL